jgi:hypothetical protein
MPQEQLQSLLDGFLDKSNELNESNAALEAANEELTAAQAVVVEKQGLVDEVVSARLTVRNEYNAAIDALIAQLQSLKAPVA